MEAQPEVDNEAAEDFEYDSDDSEYELDLEPPEDDSTEDPVSAWRRDDNFKFSQRFHDQVDHEYGPTFNLPEYATKSIFEYAVFFLPRLFIVDGEEWSSQVRRRQRRRPLQILDRHDERRVPVDRNLDVHAGTAWRSSQLLPATRGRLRS